MQHDLVIVSGRSIASHVNQNAIDEEDKHRTAGRIRECHRPREARFDVIRSHRCGGRDVADEDNHRTDWHAGQRNVLGSRRNSRAVRLLEEGSELRVGPGGSPVPVRDASQDGDEDANRDDEREVPYANYGPERDRTPHRKWIEQKFGYKTNVTMCSRSKRTVVGRTGLAPERAPHTSAPDPANPAVSRSQR